MLQLMKRRGENVVCLYSRLEIGRGGRIRTCDPQHPMLVRYQTALRPDIIQYSSGSGIIP